MSMSSPSNDISANNAVPSSSPVSAVSGAESTAAAVAIFLQAQSAAGAAPTNANAIPSSHHMSPSSSSPMSTECGGGAGITNASMPSAAGPQNVTTNSLIQDLALQQHMLQVKQQQLIQRQILEQQFQRNREMLEAEHERQLSLLLQQVGEINKLISKQEMLVVSDFIQ